MVPEVRRKLAGKEQSRLVVCGDEAELIKLCVEKKKVVRQECVGMVLDTCDSESERSVHVCQELRRMGWGAQLESKFYFSKNLMRGLRAVE